MPSTSLEMVKARIRNIEMNLKWLRGKSTIGRIGTKLKKKRMRVRVMIKKRSPMRIIA